MAAELPFVGRQAERSEFRTRLKTGRGGAILLAGDEGIGKSRLLQVWLDEAAAGGKPVGCGQCLGPEPGAVLHPWRQAVRQYCLAASLSSDALPEPFGQAPPVPDPVTLAERLADLLTAGPAGCIALEDLQWADAASLELLSCFAAATNTGPLLVIATFRPGELKSPRIPGLLRLGAAYFRLGQLSESEVRELAERAGKPRAAADVYARTRGIPLYAVHVLASPGGKLPPEVQLGLSQRLVQLAPQAAELMQMAALVGDRFDPETLARLAELPEEALISSLESAAAAGIIEEEGNGFRFAHALWRETLLDSMLGLKRRWLQRRAAGLVPHVQEAGDRAMLAGERGPAARLYGQALTLAAADDPGRPELLLRVGTANLAVDPEVAQAHLDEACRAAGAAGDRLVASLAQYHLALHFPGRAARRGPRVMDEAHRELTALRLDPRLAPLWEILTGRPPHSAGAPDGLAQAYLWSGRPAEAEAIVRASIADGGQDVQGAGDQWVLAEVALLRGDLTEAFEGYRRSVREALDRRDHLLAAQRAAQLYEEFLRHCGDQKAEVLALKEWATEISQLAAARAGAVVDPRAPYAAEQQIWADWDQGRREQAQRRLRELLAPVRPGSAPRYGDYGRKLRLMITMSRLLRLSGECDGAREWLSTVDQWLAGPRPSPLHQAYAHLERADLLRTAGESEAARQAAEAALEAGQRFGATAGLVRPAESVLAALDRPAPRSRQGAKPDQPLTRREAEVVRLVAQGLTDREVGARLFLSPRTVDGHLRNVFSKLGLQSRAGLAAWAVRNGFIGEP